MWRLKFGLRHHLTSDTKTLLWWQVIVLCMDLQGSWRAWSFTAPVETGAPEMAKRVKLPSACVNTQIYLLPWKMEAISSSEALVITILYSVIPKHTISFILTVFCLFVFGATSPQWTRASSFTKFLDHTQRRTTFGRTPLDEWSARCRDLYLTAHNTHNRQTSMSPVGFEPTISAGERP